MLSIGLRSRKFLSGQKRDLFSQTLVLPGGMVPAPVILCHLRHHLKKKREELGRQTQTKKKKHPRRKLTRVWQLKKNSIFELTDFSFTSPQPLPKYTSLWIRWFRISVGVKSDKVTNPDPSPGSF